MKEQNKYEVIKCLVDENGNKNRATEALGMSIRQINRMLKGYKEKEKAFFVHGNRGRRPVSAMSADLKQTVVDLYITKYYDSNFTHYQELLSRNENIKLYVSTVENILESNNIFSPRVTKSKRKSIKEKLQQKKEVAKSQKEKNEIQKNIVTIEDAHSRRPRSAYFGELLQMDASQFYWFGNKKTYLHFAVDDATGTITGAYFDDEETLNGYYHIFNQILTTHGIPYKFFTDRRTNRIQQCSSSQRSC